MAFACRFRDLMKKYGKVAVGVHFSVSAASITGLYVAIKNNVDVASVLERVGLPGLTGDDDAPAPDPAHGDPSDRVEVLISDDDVIALPLPAEPPRRRNRTADLAASSGGALALAVLCNKALFPVRVPITIALTPPLARFLARRNLIKTI